MNDISLSRRELLWAAGGITVTGVFSRGVPAFADKLDSLGKDLVFRTTDPRNGEPELSKLVQSWITPTKHFYVRSHAPNPAIDAGAFRLRIEGMVRRPIALAFGELSRFPTHAVTATLTCAGNRRAEFNQEAKVGGVQWQAGAIGNATWSGVSLADVLNYVEVQENARHVWFDGLDQVPHGDGVIPFGGSIPIEKALSTGSVPGTLLADKMNDAVLTPDHGYPLRTVVPGYIGARSVKWLGKIVVSDRPSPNHYVATAYKLVKQTDPIDWSESGPIYRYPINGAIAQPASETRVDCGPIEVRGYLLPSGRVGARGDKVLISADEGSTWSTAEFTGQNADFCWQLWQARVNVTTETRRLLMKGADTAGGFMPRRVPWNAKGYLQNAWYSLPIQVS